MCSIENYKYKKTSVSKYVQYKYMVDRNLNKISSVKKFNSEWAWSLFIEEVDLNQLEALEKAERVLVKLM